MEIIPKVYTFDKLCYLSYTSQAVTYYITYIMQT
jgi:hypothetical protein